MTSSLPLSANFIIPNYIGVEIPFHVPTIALQSIRMIIDEVCHGKVHVVVLIQVSSEGGLDVLIKLVHSLLESCLLAQVEILILSNNVLNGLREPFVESKGSCHTT